MAPGRGGPVSSPRSNRACGSTPLPSGAPTTRRRVPQGSPAIKGPRVSPSALNPPAPRLQGPLRERPVPQPRPCLAPRPRPTPGPGPAPPTGAVQPGPDRSRAAQNTRGEPRNAGKASRLPPSWPQGTFSGRGGER
ncbi:hypothetical protein NDU88_001667 [Pleurodeles waltl]|uniref:Uncharacterized protein n=1 Tax=Pleurodeles waltl TaxID=8319 RepID=A0AAV7W0X8_PLEWA|nr:hypothetical protein NDU88_001667 [Pleurodeles waltl]